MNSAATGDLLVSGLNALELSPDEVNRVLPLLLRYLADLELGARRYGLISREDAATTERIVSRHILDSLQPWRRIRELLSPERRTLYDIGSGAGLPGIPLAILLSRDIETCVLVERRSKRARFLMATSAALPEVPLRVVEDDFFRLVPVGGVVIPGALVLFRAWTPADATMSAALRRSVDAGTPIVMYKGRPDTAEAEAEILRSTGDYDTVAVELLPERSLIVATTRSC